MSTFIIICVASGILALSAIGIGIFAITEGLLEAVPSIVFGILCIGTPFLLKNEVLKTPEKQFIEKQQKVIDAQKELEKFLIDYPEFKECE